MNNRYVAWGTMKHHELDEWWTDAGAILSLHRAANLVAKGGDNPVLAGFRSGTVSPHADDPHGAGI